MAGPAQGALLVVLLLAGSAASTDPEGELCAREGALGCPQLRDGADAQMCCSACRLFACCPAGGAQLEGRRGPREAQTTRPQIQDEPWKSIDWKPILMFLLLCTVLLLLWMAAFYCKGHLWPRGAFFLHPSMPDYANQASFPLNSLPPPSPAFPNQPPPYEDGQPGFAASPPPYEDTNPAFLISPPLYDHASPDLWGPPPPYDPTAPTVPPPPAPYSDDPPPYSVEDPLGNRDRPPPPPSPSLSSGSSGGEADVGPLVPQNVPGYSSTSTLEADA